MSTILLEQRSRIQRAGAWVMSFLRVLGYQRFPLGMVAALFVLLQVPQIREFLLIYRLPDLQAVWEASFVAVSALAAWYAGRMTYRVEPESVASPSYPRPVSHPKLRRQLPRAYALLVPLAPALASWQLGLYDKAVMYAGMGAVIFGVVQKRRSLMRVVTKGRTSLAPDPEDEAAVYRWRDLSRAEHRWILLALVTGVMLWLLSAWQPMWAAAMLGTTGVLFLSGGVVAILGTVAMQLVTRAQWPFTLALVAWVVVVAMIPFGKLHYIDSADPSSPSVQEQTNAPMPNPFRIEKPVLVAAEGGGIRAAYWTALALHTLDAVSGGDFRHRVTLASGVSGGSLGLATYAMTENATVDEDCTLRTSAVPTAQWRALELGHCFLAFDYLGPTTLRLLWFDPLRLFVPVPLWTDRGEALEDAWAIQWAKLTETDGFTAPLSRLLHDDTVWIFNSTHVQTGRRVIQSAPWIPDLANLAPAALDGRAAVGLDIRLNQAVHNSARFSYVSPSGAVVRDDSVLQLVDGGYFENSGLSIVNDWLIYDRQRSARAPQPDATDDPFAAVASKRQMKEIVETADISSEAKVAQPVVLLLSNDPSVAPEKPEQCRSASAEQRPSGKHELVAPVASLLQTRSARGSYARDQTRRLVRDENFLQLAIEDSTVSVPLGWALSEESMLEMQRQMWCAQDSCESANRRTLLDFAGRFGWDAAAVTSTLNQLCADVMAEAR